MRSTMVVQAPDLLLAPRTTRSDGATLVMVYAAVLMITPARLVLAGLPISISPADIIGLIVGVCWLCAQLTTSSGMAKGRTPVRTSLFVYVTVLIATYAYAIERYLPADEVKAADRSMVVAVATAGIMLMASDGIRTRERVEVLLRCIVGLGAVQASIGILQFFDLDLTHYLELPFLRYTEDLSVTLERSGFLRPSGTSGQPIAFGIICTMILPLAAHFGFQAASRRQAAVWWLCTALLGLGVVFSVSRSAILGLVLVAIVLFATWSPRRRIRVLLVAAVFLVPVKFLVPGLFGALINTFTGFSADNSVLYRTNDYPIALGQVLAKPWLGHGYGTWYASKHNIFDNQYLVAVVETGLVGLIAFCLLMFSGIYCAYQVRRMAREPGVKDLAATLIACLLVPIAGSATFDLVAFTSVAGLTFLLIGVTSSLWRCSAAARA